MKKLVTTLSLSLLLGACGFVENAVEKFPITMEELAVQLCTLAAMENPPAGVDVAELAEDAARTFCEHEAHWTPFLAGLDDAKLAGSREVGLAK